MEQRPGEGEEGDRRESCRIVCEEEDNVASSSFTISINARAEEEEEEDIEIVCQEQEDNAVSSSFTISINAREEEEEEEDAEIQSIERQTRVLLDCKEEDGNKEVFDLIKEYLEGSLKTLGLCGALKKGLQQVRDRYRGALHQYEEEKVGKRYKKKTLEEELKKVKGIQSPFGEDFMKVFGSVYEQQTQMLEKLELRKNEFNKKLKHRRRLREILRFIFISKFAAASICSVLVSCMGGPPVAAAVAGVLTVSLVPAAQFFNSKLKKYEKIIKGHKDVIVWMHATTQGALKDLKIIKTLVKNLDGNIKGMVKSAEDDTVEKVAAKKEIKEIQEKAEVLKKTLEKLDIQNVLCSRDIHKARNVVLKRISR